MAIEDLLTKIRFKRKILGENVVPIVKLSETFMKTRFGGRQQPHLEIVRWVRIGGGPALAADPEPKQLTASPPTAPTTSAARAPELGPKLATAGEQLDTFAKTGTPVEAPATRTDLNDDIPF